MAKFDVADWTNRLLNAPGVPKSWFSSAAKSPGGILYAIMGGLAAGLALISGQQAYGKLQTRLATRTDTNLDGTSQDFFDGKLPRAAGELDPSFSTRIRERVVAPITTGPAMESTVNAYLEAETPLEQSRVFDAGDDPSGAEGAGLEDGQFAVELYAPASDCDVAMCMGAGWLGFSYLGVSRYRVFGVGNCGAGCAPVTVPFASRRLPKTAVDPNITAIIDDAKADGVEPTYRFFLQ